MRLDDWWTEVSTAVLARREAESRDWPGPRVEVHRNNLREARIAALVQIYTAVHRVVGPSCFRAWATRYIEARTSAAVDLNHHGRDFPAWLRHYGSVSGLGGLEYLPDLARLERAVNEAYYALDGPQERATIATAPGAALSVVGSLRTVASRHPVDEIWRLNLDGSEACEVMAEPGWRRLVIWRPARQVLVEAVPADVFRLLRQLARDPRLDVLVDSGLEPAAAARLVVKRWITGSEACVV